MFIPEFWVGVGTTLLVEVVMLVTAAFISIAKDKNKSKNNKEDK